MIEIRSDFTVGSCQGYFGAYRRARYSPKAQLRLEQPQKLAGNDALLRTSGEATVRLWPESQGHSKFKSSVRRPIRPRCAPQRSERQFVDGALVVADLAIAGQPHCAELP